LPPPGNHRVLTQTSQVLSYNIIPLCVIGLRNQEHQEILLSFWVHFLFVTDQVVYGLVITKLGYFYSETQRVKGIFSPALYLVGSEKGSDCEVHASPRDVRRDTVLVFCRASNANQVLFPSSSPFKNSPSPQPRYTTTFVSCSCFISLHRKHTKHSPQNKLALSIACTEAKNDSLSFSINTLAIVLSPTPRHWGATPLPLVHSLFTLAITSQSPSLPS